MPRIVLNPRLENHVKLVDYKEYFDAPAAKQDELMDWYEHGYMLVLTNYRFQAGREHLSTILFPNEKRAKKIALATPDNPHDDGTREREWTYVEQELLAADPARMAAFRSAVVAANTELFRLVDGLFPRYRYTRRMCIYNLSEMFSHNLHFDSPQHAGEVTQVRAFVNLDDYPRIWHLAGRLEEYAKHFYGEGRLERTIGAHPREFTRQLTRTAFGDRYESGSRDHPQHNLAFQPGEVWFLNPNMTAHEVVYGRRLLDGVFMFDAGDLRHPGRFFPEIVRDIHRQEIGPARHWARATLARWLRRGTA